MIADTFRPQMDKKVIGFKYCGGCNSVINRVGLADAIRKILPADYIIATDEASAPWNTGVIICGCAAACVDKPRIRNLAERWIVVAGKSVDLDEFPEEKIAEIVTGKIIG